MTCWLDEILQNFWQEFTKSLSTLSLNDQPIWWRISWTWGVRLSITMTSKWARWCLKSLNRLFRRRSKKTSKLYVTGICEGNSWPVNSPHKGPVTRKMYPFDDVIRDLPLSSSFSFLLFQVKQWTCCGLMMLMGILIEESLSTMIGVMAWWLTQCWLIMNKNT